MSSASYRTMLPRTGKLVKSDGTRLNESDLIEVNTHSDVSSSSRLGLDYRSYLYTLNMPAAAVYNYTIDIPAGLKLIGLTRTTTVVEGKVLSTFGVASGFTGVLATAEGYNFDETLETLALSQFIRATSVSDFSARTPPIPIQSPTTGSVRAPSAQTESGFQPTFNSNHIPVFRYQNVGNDSLELYVQITWQEIQD